MPPVSQLHMLHNVSMPSTCLIRDSLFRPEDFLVPELQATEEEKAN